MPQKPLPETESQGKREKQKNNPTNMNEGPAIHMNRPTEETRSYQGGDGPAVRHQQANRTQESTDRHPCWKTDDQTAREVQPTDWRKQTP
jgi:hypothetical protein